MPARHNVERRALSLLNLLRLDEAILLHLVQHAIARFGGALRTAIGRGVAIGGADNTGEKGGLVHGDIANVFIEIGERAFGKAVDGKAAAIAEINLVGVELENLLLVKTVLEFDSHNGFRHLTAPGTLGGKEEAARKLHGEGAGALGDAFAAKIGPCGAKNTHEIETGMLEKALILGGEDRVHEHSGDIVKADPAAFLAGSVKEIGEQFGLDFGALDDVAVIEQLDAAHAAASEIDVQRVLALEIGVAKRVHLDDIAVDGVPAGRAVYFRFVVAIVLQLADELGRREYLAIEDAIGRAIHAGAGLEHVTRQALIDHVAVAEPVVG